MSSRSTNDISISSCVNSGWRSLRESSSRRQRADLEVALHAGDHQQLLQLLRRLRQRIEHARVDAAGHDVIARAFGRRLDEQRRLDLHEAARAQVVSQEQHDLVAQQQVALHVRAAQVEIAVLQPQALVAGRLVVGGRHRRGLRLVQHADAGRADLDLAGRERRLHRVGRAGAYRALGLQDVFRAAARSRVERRWVILLVEHDLHDPVAVAQVDKDQAAVVAPAVDPARQRDRLAHVFLPQRAAHDGFQHTLSP